jgi:hypothetical protein
MADNENMGAEVEEAVVDVEGDVVEDVAAEAVVLDNTFVKQATTQQLFMKESGAGLITVEGPTEMEQAGAGLIVADGGVNMSQAGAGVAVANVITAEESAVGILVASEAAFSEDSRVIITAMNAVILGVVMGVVFGLVAGLADYGIRGYYQE